MSQRCENREKTGYERQDFQAKRCISDITTGLPVYRGLHSSLKHVEKMVYSDMRHLPWWTAKLHPSQKTIALLFSPSESSQIAHVESSEGMAISVFGMFFVFMERRIELKRG